ncbi:MAG: ABC transporter permease [Armatimonadota bacterium]
MNLGESILVALEGIAANKMRAALTMLGVIIGVGAVITMLALATGARERMMNSIQSMGTNVLIVFGGRSGRGGVRGGFGSSQVLTLEDAEAILKECPSVEAVAPESGGNAQVKYRNQNTNTGITGTTPSVLGIRNYQVQEGRFFTDSEVKSLKRVAVIGPTTAETLFGTVSPVGKQVRIRGMQFEVIGLLASKGAQGFNDQDDTIMIPVTTAMRRVFGTDNIRMISAQAKTMKLMDQASTEIGDLLRKRHHIEEGSDEDFNVRSQAEFMQMANEAAGIFTLLLGGIASVSLLVGGIGIMNIMLVSVTERTREIGIRMALGARRRDIQLQFLVEALMLSLLGGAVGILLGFLGAWGLSRLPDATVSVSLSSVLMSFGFAAFVGIFFGYYPALQASRLNPIDALRYE